MAGPGARVDQPGMDPPKIYVDGRLIICKIFPRHPLLGIMQQRASRLYLGTSLVFVLLVFWAFARQFYLAAFSGAPPLAVLLRVHGVVMTGWIVLLAVQSALISIKRLQWHRWLGIVGVVWAAMVVVMGAVVTVHASAREVRGRTDFAPMQLTVTGLELMQMLLFAIFVAGAVWWRRRGDFHKRLMLLTIITMLPSVIPRLPVNFFPSNGSILLAVDATLLILVGIDTGHQRRLHPAFGWGGILIIATFHLAFLGAYTPAWRNFLSGLVS